MKIEIDEVPKTKPHLFADAVELATAFDDGSPFSMSDAHSLLQTALHPGDELLDVGEQDLDDNDYPDDVGSVEITAKEQLAIEDCYGQLEFRSEVFGDLYPFEIEDDYLKLKADLTNKHFYYLFLLAASRSRSFKAENDQEKGIVQHISNKFEEVCRDALSNLMSDRAKVVLFGPTSNDRRQLFHTDLRQAIPKLADFMGMGLASNWRPEEESPQGDARIDLVGVQQLDPYEKGWHVFLGQCASMESDRTWEKKRAEAHIRFHSSRFHCTVDSQGVLFVPVFYRKANGNWVNPHLTTGIILMDRLRIAETLRDTDAAIGLAEEFVREHLW